MNLDIPLVRDRETKLRWSHFNNNQTYFRTVKLQKKYGGLGEIVRAHIQRDNNNSMGLALAGHRNRYEMGCFVAGINPKGNANNQNLEIGDEILEVNWYFWVYMFLVL